MIQKVNSSKDREIGIGRLLDFPVEQVWEVWTNPKHIAQWWGPEGFTNKIHTMELKPAGEWRLTMHGPDGKNYPNKSMFTEIQPLQKIVFQHYNPHYVATILFEPRRNKTFLDWTMQFETAELFQTVVKVFKADEGLRQNVEKLETYLSKIKTDESEG